MCLHARGTHGYPDANILGMPSCIKPSRRRSTPLRDGGDATSTLRRGEAPKIATLGLNYDPVMVYLCIQGTIASQHIIAPRRQLCLGYKIVLREAKPPMFGRP